MDAYSEDAVHDLRVSARRVRALLELLAPATPRGADRKARRSVRRILRATRALRDADVQAAAIAKRFEKAGRGSERPALEFLVTRLEARRLRRRRKGMAKLRELHLADVTDDVLKAIERATARLDQHGARAWPGVVHVGVRACMEGAFAPIPVVDDDDAVARLHAVRISTKRLRYTLDLLRSVLEEPSPEMFDEFKRIQRLLGDHHDLALLSERVKKELAALERAGSTVLAEGIEHELLRIGRERRRLFRELRLVFVSEDREALRLRVEACLPRTASPTARPGLAVVRPAATLKAASGS